MAEPPPLPTLEDARGWVGQRVDGMGGRAIGRVSGIHVDATDGEPRWVIGPLSGHTALPFEHVAEGADRLWAAYERDWVREAPRFKPEEALTADQELELCAHWSIPDHRGRAAQLEGHGPNEVTALAVPEA
ncbi:MAG: hypothetical protein EXQ70_10005 [Solirubrobacterales bacterium]|nr:hypothetical protein [Solirubrobacterales bacterium]